MSDSEGLTTLDQFGGRRFVIPAEVKGRFRTLRDRTYAVLILFFLLLPWIHINGLQAVLFDVPNRRFEIFGMLFLAHDAPLIFLILITLALALALATAVFGRVWCGWACPQTVFIDGVYRRIEIWIEGNYIERRRLRDQDFSFSKLAKIALKWTLFTLVSSIIAHSFIAYFAGSRHLLEMMQAPPGQNWSYFVIVTFVTAVLLFNFGWFREQFCTIMCPYGRFQSVLMDASTVTVAYDAKRGEPRKSAATKGGEQGDCVSCNRCVQVCPTAIDIRNGLQLECIACTACIDACDEIMTKVNKPTGLIRYQSATGSTRPRFSLRARAYAGLIVIFVTVLTVSLIRRDPYHLLILRGKEMPYQQLDGGQVINHFRAHLLNQSHHDQEFEIRLPEELVAKGVKLTQARVLVPLAVGQSTEVHFFLTYPSTLLSDKGDGLLELELQEHKSGSHEEFEVRLVGPIHSNGS